MQEKDSAQSTWSICKAGVANYGHPLMTDCNAAVRNMMHLPFRILRVWHPIATH